MPETIKNNENGLVVQKKNPEQLAGAIKKLITDKNLAAQFGKEAKIEAEKEFSLNKMILKTENVYRENL